MNYINYNDGEMKGKEAGYLRSLCRSSASVLPRRALHVLGMVATSTPANESLLVCMLH